MSVCLLVLSVVVTGDWHHAQRGGETVSEEGFEAAAREALAPMADKDHGQYRTITCYPAGIEQYVKSVAAALRASSRAAMEEACAAVCEMCRKGIVVSDKHMCSPIRRAFAEGDAAAIRKMAEEGDGDAR
jgi:hypothetical protein